MDIMEMTTDELETEMRIGVWRHQERQKDLEEHISHLESYQAHVTKTTTELQKANPAGLEGDAAKEIIQKTERLECIRDQVKCATESVDALARNLKRVGELYRMRIGASTSAIDAAKQHLSKNEARSHDGEMAKAKVEQLMKDKMALWKANDELRNRVEQFKQDHDALTKQLMCMDTVVKQQQHELKLLCGEPVADTAAELEKLRKEVEILKSEKDKAYRQSTDYFQLAMAFAYMSDVTAGMLTRETDPEWPLLGIKLPTGWVECHVHKDNIIMPREAMTKLDDPFDQQAELDEINRHDDKEDRLREFYQKYAPVKRRRIQDFLEAKIPAVIV